MPDDDVRVPAGWYPDPLGLPQLRWWDNHSWTEHTSDARQPMVSQPLRAQSVPIEQVSTFAPRLAFADDLPFANDLPFADDLIDLEDTQRYFEEPLYTGATDLPSRRALREQERLAHDDVHDLAGDSPRFAEPLSELEAPTRGNEVATEMSSAARAAQASPVDDAPRTMRYDLEEQHEDLLGVPSTPRSSFDHASSLTTTFVPAFSPEPAYGMSAVGDTGYGPRRTALSAAPSTSTVPGWILTLIPAYMLLMAMLILLSGPDASFAPFALGIVLGAPWIGGVVLAIADRRRLLTAGMISPAHWAWAFLGAPVYLIARLVATVREAGTGFGPVLTYFALVLFTIVGIVAVPGLVMELAPSTFSAEAERSVTQDASSIGAQLTIDCPETPPLLVQQSFTCT
ncbi:MAG: DUF2510 domain-containing protein, partial [Pseudolysinimonas sp.]